MNQSLPHEKHTCDFCVVGGGLAGMCAAISAARHGLSVVILQDRPLFGGNASGEIRMWVCGAHGENNRETGIMEEIALENLHRNPYRTFPIWDSILYEFIRKEKNITYLLNCSCLDCTTENSSITSVTGWQMSTQCYHTVSAKYFADCSGDSILAPLSGALYTSGREARAQYNESIAPEVADKKTMGNTCLIQARETTEKRTFIAPDWAYKFTKEEFVHRFSGNMNNPSENFWYLELGGTQDTITDAESLRDELLALAYGMWDYVKNSGEVSADNWELDFVGFLPGKRESRRYIGDYVMNQNDVAGSGRFEDLVAFGGWSMDDHNPEGIRTREPATIFHPAPSPFGIPYRSLYSKNIQNLFFAGRNISVTHSAMSATRVMATCATIGQAVGTAAYLAHRDGLSPRGVYENDLSELKQTLMEDGCYLPGNAMEASSLMRSSEIISTGKHEELLTNGYDRKIGGNENCWTGKACDTITVLFPEVTHAESIRIALDSDLDRKTIGAGRHVPEKATLANRHLDVTPVHTPETLVKHLKIELTEDGKAFIPFAEITDNHQQIIRLPIGKECRGVRITPLATHGAEEIRIFSVNIR
ncbi:MAG: FAD-dependent oxidoreductase [Clostridia bacterium]|nr:FAD-dependent oxidoreductase [Clostridia bacterium]